MSISIAFLSAFITIFSLGLLSISLKSYRKSKNTKLLFISLVFLTFFTKGIILSITVFIEGITLLESMTLFLLFDFLLLFFLFIGTLKR